MHNAADQPNAADGFQFLLRTPAAFRLNPLVRHVMKFMQFQWADSPKPIDGSHLMIAEENGRPAFHIKLVGDSVEIMGVFSDDFMIGPEIVLEPTANNVLLVRRKTRE